MQNRLLFFCCYYLFLSVLGVLIEGLFLAFHSGGRCIKLGFTHFFDSGVYIFGGCVLFYTILFFYQRSKYPLFNPLGTKLYGRQLEKKIHLADIVAVVFLPICLTLIEFIIFYVFLKCGIRFYDYSAHKYNVLGLISPKISFFWFLISLLYYFILFPIIYNIRYKMINNPHLKARNFWPVFIILIFYIVDVVSGIYMMYNFYKQHPEMNSKTIYFPYSSHRKK